MTPLGNEDLKIELTDAVSGSRIYKLSGVLTIRTLFEFQDLARRETKSAILDFSEVPYMDSAGLGCVVNLFMSCQRQQRRFAVIHVPERIMTLFRISHVDSLLPAFSSLDAAESEFARAG